MTVEAAPAAAAVPWTMAGVAKVLPPLNWVNVRAVVPMVGAVVFVHCQSVFAFAVPAMTLIIAPMTSSAGTAVVRSWSMSKARTGVTPAT